MSENKAYDNKGLQKRNNGYWPLAVLLGVILFTSAIRIRLLEVPLERDEGHYAYAGQLMLEGVPPYTGVYTYFLPGMYLIYALIMAVFGQTHGGIHLGLLIINTATILLMFFLGKRLFGPLIGAAAAVAFALLSLGQPVQGVFANSEHFVIFFAIGGIILVLRAIDTQRYLSLLAGAVLLGAAFLIKQHSAAFIAFMAVYLLFCELRRRPFTWKFFVARSLVYLVGVLLPFALTCFILWRVGVFDKFVFWTFHYARECVSRIPFLVGIKNLKMKIIEIGGSALLLWLLACLGLIYSCWNSRMRRRCPFIVGLTLFSFLATCPGFYFRPHYFILFLPAVALSAGIGAACVQNFFARRQSVMAPKATPIILGLILLFHTVYQQRNFFFVMSPTKVSRITYGFNPFPESLEIANFIREHSDRDDRIAIMGSEPQIFFYSNRRSASGYIMTYQLMEQHLYALQMQQEMIQQIEAAKPKFLIFVNVSASWLARPTSEKLIFKWFQQYCKQYYRKVGAIDIISEYNVVYRWGQDAGNYRFQSPFRITIFQRNQ